MTRTPDDPFLRDIAAAPDDPAPLLIYADWLEDNGDPSWAEFIRLRHELAGVIDDARRRGRLVSQEHDLIARITQSGHPLPAVLLNVPRVRETPGGLPLRVVNSIGMTLALVPAGVFLMGSRVPEEGMVEASPEAEELGLDVDYNYPRHGVVLTQPFYLGVHAVTWAEYERVADEEAREDAGCEEESPRHPAHVLCWGEAVEFCESLSARRAEKRAGRVYRLPTEAEWEYACRADTTTAFWTGHRLTAKQATFEADGPTPVGKFPANPFGLYDMHGNVLECCGDIHGVYPSEPQTDPRGPEEGDLVVFRGGSYLASAEECASYYRFADAVSHFVEELGVRVAMDAACVAGRGAARRRRRSN